jgi:dihydroorotate dehydrogenase (fumarate)
MGLELKNPLVASASPMSRRISTVKNLEEAGISAIVMYSLFEEQILHESLELDYYLSKGTETFAEALTYLPDIGNYSIGPEVYLDNLHKLKEAVSIPVIGSLNGISTGGWIHYAKMIEEAGADALELNIYYLPIDPDITSTQLENDYVTLVRDVCTSVTIPVAIKLSPFFTALPNVVRRVEEAGAKGLVLFNRFYQPDFDLANLEVVPHLVLSNSNEMRLPLRWIALLYGQVQADMALSTGVHSSEDVLKAMMAGAKVSMMASALLEHGIGRIQGLLSNIRYWMEEYEYESIKQMQGSMSQQAVAEPGALERANYIKELSSFGRDGFDRGIPMHWRRNV